jgi:hypothetical protein
LRIGMTVDEARQRLGTSAPIAIVGGGSSRTLYLPICPTKSTQGVVEFSGQGGYVDGSYTYFKGDGFLLSVSFSAGAVTRAGVGIGSTRAEVVRAYGHELKVDRYADLVVIGKPQRYAGRTATPEIAFVFSGESGRVMGLGYGTKDRGIGTDSGAC